jgi:hypothetical protein
MAWEDNIATTLTTTFAAALISAAGSFGPAVYDYSAFGSGPSYSAGAQALTNRTFTIRSRLDTVTASFAGAEISEVGRVGPEVIDFSAFAGAPSMTAGAQTFVVSRVTQGNRTLNGYIGYIEVAPITQRWG